MEGGGRGEVEGEGREGDRKERDGRDGREER